MENVAYFISAVTKMKLTHFRLPSLSLMCHAYNCGTAHKALEVGLM